MNLHAHGRDDCALTGEITIGDCDGGYPFTTGHLGGWDVKARAWAHWGERIIWGCLVQQEPASSLMHIICMDLRVGVGNAMLLYATQVHCGHA